MRVITLTADTNIYELMSLLNGQRTHVAALRLVLEMLTTEQLHDMAHACDLKPHGDRVALAREVVVHGRGLDDDEVRGLDRWMSSCTAQRRLAAAACN